MFVICLPVFMRVCVCVLCVNVCVCCMQRHIKNRSLSIWQDNRFSMFTSLWLRLFSLQSVVVVVVVVVLYQCNDNNNNYMNLLLLLLCRWDCNWWIELLLLPDRMWCNLNCLLPWNCGCNNSWCSCCCCYCCCCCCCSWVNG